MIKFLLGLATIPAAYMAGKYLGFYGYDLYEKYKNKSNQ